MSKIIKILELSDKGGSQREISRATHASLRTVSQTLRAAKAARVGAKDFVGKDEVEARLVLFGAPGRDSGYRPPDYAEVDKQLRKDGVNLSLLWDEYVRGCAGEGRKPYQYAQYCRLYAAWRKANGGARPTMRVAHAPGRVAEVDWAGSRAPYVNRTTGEVVRAWVFVACLPYSQKLFVEAFDDMRQPNWARAHIDMFAYFGGVTQLVTPDNCKTGVVKPDYYDPVVNKDYASLAAHYGFAVVPARPVTPTDKPSVENSVKFVQTWVIGYLRDQVFYSLGEVNQAIRGRVDQLNTQPFKGVDYSRDDVFTTEEAPLLAPLPATRFEVAEWRTAKVGLDYCVQVARQRYSVPYRLIGSTVDVRLTDTTVEIFTNGQRVCSHPRLTGRVNQASVDPAHMPPAHQLYHEQWNPDRFRSWARSVGPACLEVITAILDSKPHPAQTYRACMGVLSYAKTRGNSFLEDVCQRCVDMSAHPTYTQIKTLARATTTPPSHPITDEQQHLPGVGGQGLVRGAGYYRLEQGR